jgi:O-succinylbenzoate synthase
LIEISAPHVLSFIDKKPIKINGLYNPHHSRSELLDSPLECLKIKIRPQLNNLNETIELIKSLLKIKPDILLRLDGNGLFEIKELILYIEKCERDCGPSLFSAIQYIEGPLKNDYDYYSFKQIYSYPIAMDESLEVYKNQLQQLRKFPDGLNLILKPSLFGISKSFEILNCASLFHHNIVISSAYETATSIRPLLYLAALNPNTYHGFDTLKFLPKDLSIESDNYVLNF